MEKFRMMTEAELVASIRPGDKVTIRVPNGIGRIGVEWKEKSGRAVIANGTDRVVLNMGGRYGTPGVATAENIVKVVRAKAKGATQVVKMRIRPVTGGYF